MVLVTQVNNVFLGVGRTEDVMDTSVTILYIKLSIHVRFFTGSI